MAPQYKVFTLLEYLLKNKKMIPPIIHYCWLSKDKQPENVKKCIESWYRFLPNYEIRLWDIDSFDYESIPFTRDALANRKWAFVSDYIRLYALYNFGGIYLDSDVQVWDSIDDLRDNRFFSGYETRDKEHTQIYLEAAIMGAEKGHPFIKKALDLYTQRSFLHEDGSFDLTPIPTIMSSILDRDYCWVRKDTMQNLEDGITIYPTKTIANSNCNRLPSVRLYHLNNRSWMEASLLEKFLRASKRTMKLLIKKV